MIDSSAVQNLVNSYWYDYDEGNFDAWRDYFTADAHLSARTDTGKTDYEEFVRVDLDGGDAIVAWEIEHRKDSPYPMRSIGANVHVTRATDKEADFRSYLFTTQIVGGAVSNLSIAIVLGTVRHEEGRLRFADLRVVLDTADSNVFSVVRGQAV
jgi:hypothetical protein